MISLLNVAVIGVGSMGKNHVRIYNDLDNVNLVAVADIDKEQLNAISAKYKVKAYSDYKEMIGKENIDALSIAVPTKHHKPVAIGAMNKGINILLEKPIAANEEDAAIIIGCAKKNNVKLMIGHIERFNPAILEIKKRLDELGEIYKIDVKRIGPFPPRVTDVGVVIDLSVHDLDVISYLINSKINRISAEIQQKLHPSHEDSLTALLIYENGVLAILNVNYLSPTKIREISIFGKKGMFRANYLTQELSFYENKSYAKDDWSVSEGDLKKIEVNKVEPLLAEIKSFVNCVITNSEPEVNGERALETLRSALNILKNSKND